MTSMAAELGVDRVDFDTVKRQLARHLGDVLGRTFAWPDAAANAGKPAAPSTGG
jgi:hypothetical protein